MGTTQYSPLLTKKKQIAQTHANLIILVVQATQNKHYLPQLKPVLDATEKNGWVDLAKIIKKIITGQRSLSLLRNLDEEDSAIIEAILLGIQNPATLPKRIKSADPNVAGSSIAQIIQQAASGNAQALSMLGNMTQQMSKAGGDMTQLAGIMKSLVDGERNPDILCKNMTAKGEALVLSILKELKQQLHLH